MFFPGFRYINLDLPQKAVQEKSCDDPAIAQSRHQCLWNERVNSSPRPQCSPDSEEVKSNPEQLDLILSYESPSVSCRPDSWAGVNSTEAQIMIRVRVSVDLQPEACQWGSAGESWEGKARVNALKQIFLLLGTQLLGFQNMGVNGVGSKVPF